MKTKNLKYKGRINNNTYKTNKKTGRKVLRCLEGFVFSYYDKLNQSVIKRESGLYCLKYRESGISEKLRIKVLLIVGKFKKSVVFGLLRLLNKSGVIKYSNIKIKSGESIEKPKNLKSSDITNI